MIQINDIKFIKETKTETTTEQGFIEELKECLEVLIGESFQRHKPEYYDEVDFYNAFHQFIPSSLILTSCYIKFITLYHKEGKNLYEAVLAFIAEYEATILEAC